MKINKILLLYVLFSSILSLETQFIKYEEDQTTAILTINRPKALNALNSQVLEEIDKTLNNIDVNKIKALIIIGEGENPSLRVQISQKWVNLQKKKGKLLVKKEMIFLEN